MSSDAVRHRTHLYFEAQTSAVSVRTDRVFAFLLFAEWLAGIVVALLISPRTWSGKDWGIHVHVIAAAGLGGLIVGLPIALALLRPGAPFNRHVIAVGQMLWSGLLIHLTGGRIESHFIIFGSLAFLGFYRDWRVYFPATLVVAADHFIRQIVWPESIYGLGSPESWLALEHAWWVLFEDTFMILSCIFATRDMWEVARQRAVAEDASEREQQKAIELDKALVQLQRSHDSLMRAEKLAAVGKLAASVGHELRNPLGAIRNAHTYIAKKLSDPQNPHPDPRMLQFSGMVDRELNSCARIISDLLDFARERAPVLRPCPLRPLVDDALSIVPMRGEVRVSNEVPSDLAVPTLDKDQFRQVIINLVQNAVEAIPPGRTGHVNVRAEGGGARPWCIRISDDGMGIPPESLSDIFQPLFTTKTKGTGLGLAIVAGMVQRHQGTIRVESQPNKGTEFIIELPPAEITQAA